MKTTIKLSTFFSLAMLAFSTGAKAQSSPVKFSEGIIYSIGVEPGLGSGNFKGNYKWTLGGSVQADIPLAADVYVNANAGYTKFNGRNGKEDIDMIPVSAGIKFFPFSLLYVQGNAGIGILLNKADAGYQQTTAFMYAPQAGFQVPVGPNRSLLDIGVRYSRTAPYTDNVSNSKISYLSLRLAYALASE